jgi:hypothetical protein
MTTIQKAIEALSSAEKIDSPEFAAASYVEVRRNEHEVVLGGNREGLLWLALHCLKLAEQQRGSHLHLDEVGTDVCECPLVIRHWTRG